MNPRGGQKNEWLCALFSVIFHQIADEIIYRNGVSDFFFSILSFDIDLGRYGVYNWDVAHAK
jgi:hypothetical protein